MIFIQTALYYEAAGFIEYYKLKKISGIRAFQVFMDRDKEIMLIVGGTGPVNGSVSATFLLSGCGANASTPFSATEEANVFELRNSNDIFVNVGVCGGVGDSDYDYRESYAEPLVEPKGQKANYNIGDIVLCNKIFDSVTGRTAYPEMLYTHPFAEGGLYSSCREVSISYRNDERVGDGWELADMEGAFAFQAAAKLMPLDRIFVIKVVSDHFEPGRVTKEMITELMRKRVPEIGNWLTRITGLLRQERFQLPADEADMLCVIGQALRLSVTMKNVLFKYCKYAALMGCRTTDILSKYVDVTCENKEGGKLIYAGLIKELKAEQAPQRVK